MTSTRMNGISIQRTQTPTTMDTTLVGFLRLLPLYNHTFVVSFALSVIPLHLYCGLLSRAQPARSTVSQRNIVYIILCAVLRLVL